MQIKRIQCPVCKVTLDVRNSANEQLKTITCPQCNSILNVKFEQKNDTTLAKRNKQKNNPRLICNGKTYPIEEGCNIVGRKAPTSSATIQIDTADRTMSRLHVKINVTKFSDAPDKIVISNYKNQNDTEINGQVIETGEEIRLIDGYQIRMGDTVLTFKA